MKNFEMPNVKKVSFSQFENISGACGPVDDTIIGSSSNPEVE